MDKFNEEFMRSLLSNLENTSWETSKNICYNVLVMIPDQCVQYDEKTARHKLHSLEKILSHFEEQEDFEKCAKLKKIQDQLKNC